MRSLAFLSSASWIAIQSQIPGTFFLSSDPLF